MVGDGFRISRKSCSDGGSVVLLDFGAPRGNASKALTAVGEKALVHCNAAISRSPAVVAAFLSATTGISAKDALKIIQEKRWMARSRNMAVDPAGVGRRRPR